MPRNTGKKIYVKKDAFQVAMMRAGYSGAALAREVFVSRQAMNFAINRVNGVAPATAKKITEKLGKEFDDIFEII